MGTLRSKLQADEGFTLIELIVGMVITALIIGSIASALIVTFRTTDVTQRRMSESHDAQITSAYLANDVQSAAAVNVSTASENCGVSTPTTVVTFTYTGGAQAIYRCGTSNGETQVTRTFGSSTAVVAHFAGSARPAVTCTPSPCTSVPLDSVKIGFASSGGYAYSLLGSRRALNPTIPNPPAGSATGDVTFFVLGGSSQLWVSGSCPQGLIDNQNNQNNTCIAGTESDPGQPTNPKLTVLGNLFVNSTTTGAVKLTGRKSDVRLSIQGGDFKILQGGTCQGCTNQSVVCPQCTTTPPPGSYSVPLLDPLRFMTAPVETGLSVYSDGNYHGPGVYTNRLSLSASRAFAPGIYILNNGMSVTGSGTISGTGVTLYNKGGDISFGGSSTITLSPPTSGQYKGVLIFQARTNTNTLSLQGGSGVSPIGIIYAPNATEITLGIGSASLRVTAVIAQSIKISGSAQVTIG